MEINIYKKARELANMTQEELAFGMELSVTSIKAYESGETKPTINKVIKMCEILEDFALQYEHLQKEGLLSLLPKYEGIGMQGAAITLYATMQDAGEEMNNLFEIVKDGKIDLSEEKDFEEIIEKIEGLIKPIIELKYAPRGR